MGAYYGYSYFCEYKGWSPVSLDTLDKTEIADFYGTYFSKTKAHNVIPDTMTYYSIPVTQVSIDGTETNGLYDLEQFQQRDKYAAFLWGNHGITVIKVKITFEKKKGRPAGFC